MRTELAAQKKALRDLSARLESLRGRLDRRPPGARSPGNAGRHAPQASDPGQDETALAPNDDALDVIPARPNRQEM